MGAQIHLVHAGSERAHELDHGGIRKREVGLAELFAPEEVVPLLGAHDALLQLEHIHVEAVVTVVGVEVVGGLVVVHAGIAAAQRIGRQLCA